MILPPFFFLAYILSRISAFNSLCFFLFYCLAYFLTLKMVAIHSAEMSSYSFRLHIIIRLTQVGVT
jgi:hypothetical protein